MNELRLPAIFSGLRSRKDRTFTLSFETRELAGKTAADLMDMQQTAPFINLRFRVIMEVEIYE